MRIDEQLVQYGLSDKEAKVYRFLIENTEASAPHIAKSTGIPRATVYLLLESLKSRGLISTTKRNNVQHFFPESPNRLKTIAQDRVSLADMIIPQLRTLASNDKFNPTTKLYVGKEGMKLVFEDMLETFKTKKIKHLYSITDSSIINILPRYFPEWIKEREKLGVFTQMIGEREDGSFPFPNNKLRAVRLLPKSVAFDCSINIYGDKLAFYSIRGEEIYCMTIESPTVATTIKQMFFLVWESLGEQN